MKNTLVENSIYISICFFLSICIVVSSFFLIEFIP